MKQPYVIHSEVVYAERPEESNIKHACCSQCRTGALFVKECIKGLGKTIALPIHIQEDICH